MHLFADTTDTIVRIPAPIVQLIIVVLIPIVTGLVTKYSLSSVVKGFITLVLAALTAFVSSWVVDGGDAILTSHALYNAALNFVISVAMYFGIYKPANLTSSALGGKLLPHVGIGPTQPS